MGSLCCPAGQVEVQVDAADGVRILSAVSGKLALPVSESAAAKAKPEALREELRLRCGLGVYPDLFLMFSQPYCSI